MTSRSVTNISKTAHFGHILCHRIGFASERERVERLFALYEKMRARLEARVRKGR